MRSDRVILLLLPVFLALFAAGVVRLFQLRFETGDVYPPSSSLRADPLGTKAFYESLHSLRPSKVQRFTRRLDKLPQSGDTTLLVLGADPFDLKDSTEDEYATLEHFMFGGGRIVVSCAPVNSKPWGIRDDKTTRKNSKARSPEGDGPQSDERMAKRSKSKRNPAGDEEDPSDLKIISLKERWNVGLEFQDLPKGVDDIYESVVARRRADLVLPESVVWHTALYFDNPETNWTVIYDRDTHPVLIERKFGRGTLVLSADSYFLSNEAMRKSRYPELLAWLVGLNSSVLFDETHLGVMETPGVAALVRKYRLHGLAAALVLLAGLFVWKNAVSFVPPFDEETQESQGNAVAGKDSAAGFVNLLRRSIGPSEILPACFEEWKRARAHGRADLKAKVDRAAAVIAEEQARSGRARDPVESYRRISRILTERD